MPSLIDNLRAAIAEEPDAPLTCKRQGQTLSASARRNRVRIGLPEYPTKEELEQWKAKRG